ncbi:MAG: hypothetical protein KIT20_06665 [Alphaproteobacteria bacterium]|nr:hypothetical protein [Alphaproteobacteria bacterium]
MLALLTAVFGFLAPLLPELIRQWQRRQELRHEAEMLKLRLDAAGREHLWRMEEIGARADAAEAATLRLPPVSFGVQLLDAGARAGFGPAPLLPAFYLFALLDLLAGLVRPAVTYAAFGLYAAVKWAQYRMFFQLSSDMGVAEALLRIWREEDLAVLTLCLSYWFGHRAAKQAFGGSASSMERAR